MKIAIFSLSLLFAFSPSAVAGEFNTVLDIGDEAPKWSLVGTDDKTHSSDETKSSKLVVVAFTCNSCPYAQDVEDRLIQLHETLTKLDGTLIAINSNKVEEDRMPAMKAKAKEKGFRFTYLWDETQEVAKAFGAKFTPEFFVLNDRRQVVYMGSLDDSPAGDKITKRYLLDAIHGTLAGETIEQQETVPIGCRIRFERQRRRRSR